MAKKNNKVQEMAQIGRAAFRQEGGRWVAYYAAPQTMDGAIEIGTINMAIVQYNRALKNQFMDMMRDLVMAIVKANFPEGAEQLEFAGETPAPESERAGNA